MLDEAIELSRRFGTADSPAFVNGVLDKIAKARKAEREVRNDSSPETGLLPSPLAGEGGGASPPGEG